MKATRPATRGAKAYLLAILMTTLAVNNVDRLALGLVLQDIKTDFHLSDTQLGLLTGLAFALFYSLMGLPIARWADRGNRVHILSLCTALWSIAAALCGAATSFVQLLVLRCAVGIGEAGCIPPANSLIADHFSREERPRATSVFLMGGSLSVVIGYFVAGWLNSAFGWRIMLIALSLPGLLLALITIATLRDPRRRNSTHGASAPKKTEAPLALRATVQQLLSIRTFRQLLLCYSITSMFLWGIAQWQPTFFIRSHHLDTAALGAWFAAVFGLGALAGTWLGGEVATRRAPNNERLQLRLMCAAFAVAGIISPAIYLSGNLALALAALSLTTIASATINGPLLALIQTLAPAPARALSLAILYLSANLVGMGLGPLLTGVISDALEPVFGAESLRFSLLALSPGYIVGAWYLWCAGRSVMDDLSETTLSPDIAQLEKDGHAA